MLDEHERRDVELNIRRLYQLIESLETMTKALLEEQEMLTNATVQPRAGKIGPPQPPRLLPLRAK